MRWGETPSAGPAAGLLAVVWCRSVGSAWTLELRELDEGSALGSLRDWISSGVPISQPEPPEALARALLADRGLVLVRDPRTGRGRRTRQGIGYAHAATPAPLGLPDRDVSVGIRYCWFMMS
ncbi:MAG: hypothetical protein ACRDU4_02955 [Mycobacterium sp.]